MFSTPLIYDICIILIIGILVIQGYGKGFVPSLHSFGIFVSIGLGLVFNESLALWLTPFTTMSFIPIDIQLLIVQYLPFISLIMIIIIINCLWNLIMNVIDIATKFTLLSFANRLAGATFGFIKAIILIFLLRYILMDVLEMLDADMLSQIRFFNYFTF